MEKDIELVEEFINICEFYEQPNVVIISDTVEAIKNLINRNKELEKLEVEHKKINGNLREKIKELEYKNKQLKEYIVAAPNLDEMTAIKYKSIQENAYIRGIAEEQQRAKEIIHNDYIPKSKIQNKLKEIKFAIAFCENEDRMRNLLIEKNFTRTIRRIRR